MTELEILQQKVANLETLVDALLSSSNCPPGIPGARGRDGLDGVAGKNGLDGRDGISGDDGYTPRKNIDYFDGQDGLDGKDGIDGVNGQASFTSYVFTKIVGEIVPARPTGGSYANPFPTTGNWTDGVPAGQGTLYLSNRVFSSDGLPPQQEQWSTPKLAADSTTLDFEWSSVVNNPGNPTDNPDNWTNDADITSVWMAMRTLVNGEWSEWKIVKIKGENGDPGDPGSNGNTSIYMYAVNGSFSSPPALPPTEKNKRFPIGWSEEPLEFTGLQYQWKIVGLVDQNNDLIGNWSEPFRDTGRIGDKGDRGAYLAPKGEYSDTEQYVGTDQRVEAVLYEGNWYVTRSDAGQIPIGTLPTDTNYWDVADESFDFIATGLFLAQVAYIKNLGVENLKTSDSGTRVEIIKTENSLKFYVQNIVNPVVTIDTDVATDPTNPSAVNAGIRISALGVNNLNAVTTLSTAGIFSNAGNTNILPASTGIRSTASIMGLTFRRDSESLIDAGVAGAVNATVGSNVNHLSIGGYFDTLLHGGLFKRAIEITNGQNVTLTGSVSLAFSYIGSGQSATINLPNFNLNSGGWKGPFGTGLDRIFIFELIIINANVTITVNTQGGREIISASPNSTTFSATTGANERAVFTFMYTGSHWLGFKKPF